MAVVPLLCMALYAGVLAASPAAAITPAPTPPAAVVTLDSLLGPLVHNLGADRFEMRERATEALRYIGPAAREALEAAVKSEDPEVRVRARRLLEDLRLGITPDWPSEAVLLARRFDQMNNEERLNAMNRISQMLGPKAATFFIQQLMSDDRALAELADYAIQSTKSDDVARQVLDTLLQAQTLKEPKGPFQPPSRTMTWAQSRVGLPLEGFRVLPAGKDGAQPPAKDGPAEAGVKKLLALLAEKKLDEMFEAAGELAKASPQDARPVYLQAEVCDSIRPDEAKALRERAAALNPDDKAAHAAAAEMLHRIGWRVLAAAEFEKVLKTPPAGGAADINAQFHLGVLCRESGLFQRASNYFQTTAELCEKEKSNVIIEGGIGLLLVEGVRSRDKAQKYPSDAETPLADDLAGRDVTVEVEMTAADDKLEDYRKALKDAVAAVSLDVQPHDLKLFADVPATLRYDPKRHEVVVLLGESPCCKPMPIDLGEKPDVRLGVETPRGWFIFKVSTVTGQAQQIEQFEKVFTVRFKLPASLTGLKDPTWTVNGRRYKWEEIQQGITLAVLPNEFRVNVEGTTASNRRITSNFMLPASEPKMAAPATPAPVTPAP